MKTNDKDDWDMRIETHYKFIREAFEINDAGKMAESIALCIPFLKNSKGKTVSVVLGNDFHEHIIYLIQIGELIHKARENHE